MNRLVLKNFELGHDRFIGELPCTYVGKLQGGVICTAAGGTCMVEGKG